MEQGSFPVTDTAPEQQQQQESQKVGRIPADGTGSGGGKGLFSRLANNDPISARKPRTSAVGSGKSVSSPPTFAGLDQSYYPSGNRPRSSSNSSRLRGAKPPGQPPRPEQGSIGLRGWANADFSSGLFPAKSVADVKINLYDVKEEKPKDGGQSSSGVGGAPGGSPDSASLYSDEIPSGYNSGEQYDTLSGGYMSGEAYELPDTRMDLREPALDVINEVGAQSAASKDSDDSDNAAAIFKVHGGASASGVKPGWNASNGDEGRDVLSSTSSSDAEMDGIKGNMLNGGEWEMGGNVGPGILSPQVSFGPVSKGKPKRKGAMATLALPSAEASPLANIEIYDESSDANMPTVGGYRTVPSDTDTSAADSDGNAVLIEGGRDSGMDLETTTGSGLVAGRKLSRKEAKRYRRKLENHDEAWMMANDNKWWSAVRFICFWGSVCSMVTATVVAGVLIALMPKNCDPSTEWFQGTITMDLAPEYSASGTGRPTLDLGTFLGELPTFHSMGIQTIHLKYLTLKNGMNSSSLKRNREDKDYRNFGKTYYPTKDMIGISEEVLKLDEGPSPNPNPLGKLASALHERNMTLMIHVPVVGSQEAAGEDAGSSMSLQLQHQVSYTIKYFMENGADGIFVEGVEHFGADVWVAQAVVAWKNVMDRFGTTSGTRVLMTSYKFAQNLDEAKNPAASEALKHISLLDASLDLGLYERDFTEFVQLSEDLSKIVAWDTSVKGRPWINWNLQSEKVPLTNAAKSLQIFLPGTINVEYQGISNKEDHHNDVSQESQLSTLSNLRALAVPIFMNGNYKKCHCPENGGTTKETNYYLHQPIEGVVQMERFYSRRHRFVLVANFGLSEVELKPLGDIYSGGTLVLDTGNSYPQMMNTHVLFRTMSLSPGQSIVLKLPK